MLYLGNIPIAGLTKPLAARNVGEIVWSLIPLTDAGLHLLDGSLLQGSGIYSGFVNYIANLYNVQETEWTQPILTSNGVLGGDTFAVYASNNYDATAFPLYLSFDGNSSTIWYNSTAPVDVTIYNPNPLKITNIQCQNRINADNYTFTAGTVYGSNDNINYTQIGTFTNNVTTTGGTYNIDLSSNTNFYYYYKITFTSATQNGTGANFTITATQQSTPNYFCNESQWQQMVSTYGSCGKFVYTAPLHLYAWKSDDSIIYTQINEDTGGISENILYNTDGTTYEDGYDETYTDFGGISKLQKDNIIVVGWVNPNSTKPTTRTKTIIYSRSAEDDVDIAESVRLPKVSDILQGTTDVNALGSLMKAGLPNITSSFGIRAGVDSPDTLVNTSYSRGVNTNGCVTNSASVQSVVLSTSASLSSPIYGNSSTVQPQTIKALLYIAIANSTKTNIEVDIDEIATDLNNKVNKDFSNLTQSIKNFDGQWTPINNQLANNVTWDNTTAAATYDISSYLPDDNYNYEVMISGQATASATQQKFCTIQLTSDIQTSNLYLASARTTTTSTINVQNNATIIIPVGTGRTITQYASTSSNASGVYSLWIKGYRRIGTNA